LFSELRETRDEAAELSRCRAAEQLIVIGVCEKWSHK
jgi:hypothetical protein